MEGVGWSPQPAITGTALVALALGWGWGGRDMAMHWADPGSCFLSGETTSSSGLGPPWRRGVSPAPCNPPTGQHWLDPALKDTSAAGGSVQSGPWLSWWRSLLGPGIHPLWVPSEPVPSNVQDSFQKCAVVGMGNTFPFWCCPRVEARFVLACVLKSFGLRSDAWEGTSHLIQGTSCRR